MGSARLASRNVPVAIGTFTIAIVEPFLPSVKVVAESLARPIRQILYDLLSQLSADTVALFLLLAAAQHVLSCWFVSRSFSFASQMKALSGVAWLHYCMRAFAFQLPLILLLLGMAGLFVLIGSEPLFALSPLAEKLTFFAVVVVALPCAVMLLSTLLYEAYFRPSFGEAWRSVILFLVSVSGAYWFFAATIAFRGAVVFLCVLVLRSPVPFLLKIVVVALVLSCAGVFVRALRFEFQRRHTARCSLPS